MTAAGPFGRRVFHPRRSSELWLSELPDRVLVLSDARVALEQFHLNGIGSLIWRFCDGRHTVEDIAREITAECDGSTPDTATLKREILGFLNSLQAQGLVSCDGADDIDVLLVIPPAPSVYAKEAIQTPEYSSPPLGLCYLAAVLQQHGFRVAISDLHQGQNQPEDIVEHCRAGSPKVIGRAHV